MLQNVVRGLCRHSGGVMLVAGTIGVLAGVKHLMSSSRAAAAQPVIIRPQPARAKSVDRFSIRRTQSELGYTYWVLQGHGQHRGFALFDSWQEAMDEAQRRINTAASVQEMTFFESVRV